VAPVTWTAFIEHAPSAEHAVHLYQEPEELGRSVATFLDAGFRIGAPGIVVATPEHWQVFARELQSRGCDLEPLEREGQLTVLDADTLLATFMEDGMPSASRFADVVGGLLDTVASRHPQRTARVFGEMVDLLWQRGADRAAIALEELWNDLLQKRGFALLCAYNLDVFDLHVQRQALPEVFRTHTHARPVSDGPALTAAVDQALAEIMGPRDTARIYLDVAEQVPRTSLPRAQAVLGWLVANDSPRAATVLERARSHYRSIGRAAAKRRALTA